MAASETVSVYLILGAAGSGRREIVADLIEGSQQPGDRPAVLVSETEAPDADDTRLPRLGRWRWEDGAIIAEWPAEATQVFFVTDGRRDPVDQVEAFVGWVQAQGQALSRVITVVNCQLAEKNAALLSWYEACVHFSDVVLLNRREGVANKWLSDFLKHFEKLYYPCLFETVKGGRVRNPALVLAPEARRMTQVFDAEEDWTQAEGIDEDTAIEDEAEDEEEAEESEAPEEGEGLAEEPYFARDAAGRRKKRIPDIARFLDGDRRTEDGRPRTEDGGRKAED